MYSDKSIDTMRRDLVLGLTLRQAAVTAGIAYLLMPVAFAEFYVFPKLVVPQNVDLTIRNITAHQQLFFVGVLCHFMTLILDVIIAWSLYVLLAPVNQALSLLAGWFRLLYATFYLAGLQAFLTVLYLIRTPYNRTLFGDQQLHAQVQLLIGSFRHSINLAVFGLDLLLLGYLVYKSGYIPRVLGVVLAVVGASWVLYTLVPYLFPDARLDFILPVTFGELLFPLWLVTRGWKISDPQA